jgi:hypothetical protein
MKHSIAVRCVCAAFLFLTWAAMRADAQSAPTQSTPRNSLVKGAWALQFKVDSDAILSEFGGSVAIKRHVSAQSAFRVGFDYGLSTYGREVEGDRQSDSDTEMVGMFVDYLRYTDVESPVNFFWGTGPFGSFNRNKVSSRMGSAENESVATVWSTGISGRVGVEWFVTRSLSFHAEYFGTAHYERRMSKSTVVNDLGSSTNEISDHSWRLSRGPVVFGLSAYF